MEYETIIVLVLFGSFLALLMIGAPITVALGVSALATFLYLEENPIKFVQIAFTSVGSFPLMALPAFILAGALMEAAGISRRQYRPPGGARQRQRRGSCRRTRQMVYARPDS